MELPGKTAWNSLWFESRGVGTQDQGAALVWFLVPAREVISASLRELRGWGSLLLLEEFAAPGGKGGIFCSGGDEGIFCSWR